MMTEPHTKGRDTILVASSSSLERLLWQRQLSGLGYHVVLAAADAHSVELLKQSMACLAVVDLGDVGGAEFCEAARADADLAEIKILGIMSLTSPADLLHAVASRADKYLVRPVTKDQLGDAVSSLIECCFPPSDETLVEIETELLGKQYNLGTSANQLFELLRSVFDNALELNAKFDAQLEDKNLGQLGQSDASPAKSGEPTEQTSSHRSEQQALDQIKLIREISHQVRTPLNGILGLVHMLETEEDNEKRAEFLADIERSAKRLEWYFDEVLNSDHSEMHQNGKKNEDKGIIRALVVEDEALLQKMILRTLNAAGIRGDLAENGELAVEAFERSPDHYDVILMDKVMPKMDGLKATQRIRSLTGGADIPIIGFTADSSEEDQADWIALGASDVLNKSSDTAPIYKAFAKFLPNFEPPANQGARPTVNVSDTTMNDLNTIHDLDPKLGLRVSGGDPVVLLEALKEFASTHRARLSKIAAQFDTDDLTALGREAHSVKGTGATLGLRDISKCAERLHTTVKENKGDQVKSYLHILLSKINTLSQELETFGDLNSAQTNPQPVAECSELLSKLADKLSEDDASSESLLRSHWNEYAYCLGKRATAVGEAVNQYDFQRALTLVKEVISDD